MKKLILVLLFIPLVSYGQYKSLEKLTEADASDYLKLEGYRYDIRRSEDSSGLIKWTGVDNSKPQKRMSFYFWPQSLGISYITKQYILTDEEINVSIWENRLSSDLKVYDRTMYSLSARDNEDILKSRYGKSISRMDKPYSSYGRRKFYAYILTDYNFFGGPPKLNEIGFVKTDGGKVNFTVLDTYDLENMAIIFFNDLFQHNKKMGLPYQTNFNLFLDSVETMISNIDISFQQLEGNTIAVALGKGNFEKIEIVVSPDKWRTYSDAKRFYVLYHELGHDALNLDHGNGGKMMFNYDEKDFTWDDFMVDRIKMFNAFNNN